MIEVLFGESEAGAMKSAKSTVISSKVNGPTAVWTVGKKKPLEKEFAGWIQGRPEEVICLGFMLDIGDIKEPLDGQYRGELLYSMYAQGQWGKDPEVEAELKGLAGYYVKEQKRLEEYLEEGKVIRIWYSDAPYSRCGFYYLCTMLGRYDNEIRAVKLPEYRVGKETIVSYKNWGEISAEEFAAFLPGERTLSKEEIRMYSTLWSDLAEDDSPLRVMINGRVTGVPEDFYDFMIWKRITAEPIREARLIGDILGRYRISIGDWWYARRIEHFIEQGKIKVAEDSENSYARMICLAE